MRGTKLERFAGTMILLCGCVPAMLGAVHDRVVGEAQGKPVALPQTVSPRLKQAADLGEAKGEVALSSMSFRFNMTSAQKAALTQLLIDQQNPASARYHKWLRPEQFADRFGLSASDVAKVSAWLTAQGFKVTGVTRSRTAINFSGTVAQAQAAFQTSIHRVSLDGKEHLANVSAAALPANIAAVVDLVGGLNDFRLKPRARVRSVQASANPRYTSSITGATFIAPGDFYTIYDVKPLLSTSVNGTGMTIAVAGQTDISLNDVAAFRSASGLSANLPTVKLYGADPGIQSDDLDEAQLDVEWSGAVAPAASIVYVNSSDVITSLTRIIDDALAPIASISYGACELGTGESALNSLNQLFMQANAEGITVIGPSGDSGATDCDYQAATATQGLAVDFPASSPYVTGVGGTMFNEGSGTYFNQSNDANAGSAISYIPEAVWNESLSANELSATGGGLSSFFTKPAWQVGTGVPNDFARDVPDISFNADPDHDGYLFCSQGSCVDGFRTSATPTSNCTTGSCLNVVGGTSVSTPAFAGILALVEQKIGAATGVGNANPVIYGLANSTYYNNVFHDVTVGDNTSPCTAGSTDCPAGGSIGYAAGVGYDLATGWGSVDAFNLANDWLLVTPTGGGSTTGTTISTTTLTASAASVTSGATVTLTATVANGGSGTTGTPTGTVQFLVDNVSSGSAVTLSNGTATFALGTATLASGNHILSAAYSGDTTFAGSKASVDLDVTSATMPDFSLTPTTATVTTKAGTDAQGVLFTVTSVNGYAGAVAFSALTTSSTLNASGTFTVSPVTITAGGTGTTTLNLSAYVTNAQGASGMIRRSAAGAASMLPAGVSRSRTGYGLSGAALACLVLVCIPRPRRFGPLLGALLSVATLAASLAMSGCGSGTSTIQPQINSAPGTYTISVAATGTTSTGAQVTHNATVTFVVQ